MTVMTPASLKNVTVSTVKPYTKTEHPVNVEPSVFDLQVLDFFVPFVFFYKSEMGQEADASSMVERMKQSLSEVLVPYFPMAGRWVRTYDARIRVLECTDEGVPFIEASIDEELESVVKLNDFVATELLGGYQFIGLNGKAFHQDVDNLPSLFVQVTQFKCGSVAFHIAISHQVMDGQGMAAFMSAWSEIALRGQTSIVPVHNRSLTTSLAEFMKPSGNVEENVTKVEAESTKENINVNGSEKTRSDPGIAFKLPYEEPSINKTLHVRRQVIEDLKLEAALENIEVTTVDLITAHIWRSLNSLPESMDSKTNSIVGTWVDGRKRFHNPPLPERYSGNAIILERTPLTPARELTSNSPLFAADIVHKTVRAINPSTWQKSMGGVLQMLSDFHHLNYRHLMITSWFRFPTYEVVFSHEFGKPVLVAWNLPTGFNLLPFGIVVIHPPTPVLSKDAIATLQFTITNGNGAAETLFSDDKFLSFFL